MTELMSRPEPVCIGGVRPFAVRSYVEGALRIVEMSGELDRGAQSAAIDACSSPEHVDVLVDLSGLVFLDCAGYSALVTAKSNLERRGGSLALVNPVGEPKRLLALIDQLEQGPCAPRVTDRPRQR